MGNWPFQPYFGRRAFKARGPVLCSLSQDQIDLFLRVADPDLPSLVVQVPVKVRPSEEIFQVCVPE